MHACTRRAGSWRAHAHMARGGRHLDVRMHTWHKEGRILACACAHGVRKAAAWCAHAHEQQGAQAVSLKCDNLGLWAAASNASAAVFSMATPCSFSRAGGGP
eukprot:366467-Chlamydomonas_euryale.AAC.9